MTQPVRTKKDTYIQNVRKAGAATIIRFLGIDHDELVKLIYTEELVHRLNKEYDEMCDHELDAFNKELMEDLDAQTQLPAIWSRIKHDYHEETDGFVVGFVDAWRTDDEDEEGRVIAQVVGAVIDNKPSTFIVHCDPEARFDQTAKAAIAACNADILTKLEETQRS